MKHLKYFEFFGKKVKEFDLSNLDISKLNSSELKNLEDYLKKIPKTQSRKFFSDLLNQYNLDDESKFNYKLGKLIKKLKYLLDYDIGEYIIINDSLEGKIIEKDKYTYTLELIDGTVVIFNEDINR